MTTHQMRRRLKRINRQVRSARFTPEVREHVAWAQALNRPEAAAIAQQFIDEQVGERD